MAGEIVQIRLEAKDGTVKVFQASGNAATAMGQKVEDAGERSARSLDGANRKAAAFGAGLGLLAAAASKAGQAHLSEARQIDAVGLAYGAQAEQITDLADRMQDLGIASDDQVRISALGAQSLTRNYGITADQITQLISRSSDLAVSNFNVDGSQIALADSSSRLAAAIRGEGEAAEALGLNMSDAAVAAYAAAQGYTNYATTMTDSEKAQLRFAKVMADSAHLEGVAARQTEGFTGTVRAMKLEVADAASGFGGLLGPVGETAAVLGDVAQAAPLVGAGMGRAATGIKATTAAVVALNLASKAGVVGTLTRGLLALGPAASAAALPVAEIVYLMRQGEQGTEGLVEDINALGAAFENLPDPKLDEMWNRLAAQTANPMQVSVTVYGGKEVTASLANYDETLKLIRTDADLAAQFLTEMAAAGVDVIDGLNADELRIVIPQLELYGAVIKENGRSLQMSALDEMNAQQTRQRSIVGIDDATESVDRLSRSEQAQVTQSQASQDAMNSLATQAGGLALGLENVTGATLDGTDAIQGGINARQVSIATSDRAAEALAAETARVAQLSAAYESITGRDLGLDQLAAGGNVSVGVAVDTTQAQASLETTFRLAVQNTNSTAGLVDNVLKWGDGLIGVEGTYGKIDDLVASGAISTERHGMAQRAYNRMVEDGAGIQEDILAIQAKQAPYLANDVRNLERQYTLISGMAPAAARVALGFMDGAQSASAMAFHTQYMSDVTAGLADDNAAFWNATIDGLETANPGLLAMLETTGEVKRTLDEAGNWDGISYEVNLEGAEGAKSDMDELTLSIDALTLALGGVPPLHLEVDDSEVAGWTPPTFDPIEFPIDLKVGGGGGDASAVDALLAFGGVEPAPIVVPIELQAPQESVADFVNRVGGLGADGGRVKLYADTSGAEAALAAWVATTAATSPTVEVDGGTGRATTALGQFLLDVGAATPVLDIGGNASGATAAGDGAVGYVSGLDGVIDIAANTAPYYANLPVTGQTIGTNYINVEQRTIGGGAPTAFATGGLVTARLGDGGGPETVTMPGSAGRFIAPRDGLYDVPQGSYVSSAVATRGQGGGGGDVHIHGPVYVTAASPDLHDALNGQLLAQGRR